MNLAEMARTLGRRGGLRRAQRLSDRRRTTIARMGATARMESLRLAEVVRNNFDYVAALAQLDPPPPIVSEAVCRRALPGLYGARIKD